VRDSVGVAIVEHDAAFMDALPRWTIDTVSLQMVRGDTAQTQFTQIADAVRRSDGGFFVADRRASDIRAFDAAGRFEQVVSRAGRGPGEIGLITRLQLLPDDSLAFVDNGNRRFTVLTRDARYVRQVLFPRLADGGRVGITGQLADGRLLGSIRSPWVEAPENRDSVYRTPFAIVAFRVTPGGVTDSALPTARADTILVVPDGEAYRSSTTENGETRADEDPLRLGRNTVWTTDGRRIYAATNVANEIMEFGLTGLRRVVRIARADEPVTEADRTRLQAEVLDAVAVSGRSPAQVAELTRMVQTWRFAETYAFADRLLAGDDGTLWVERPIVLEDDARRYVVFDSTGTAIAHAALPPRTKVLRVGRGEVLGVWRDGDDVPHIARWRVVPADVR